jgi:hypothetical protein
MEINKEELRKYLVSHGLMKENQNLFSCKLRPNQIKGLGQYIDFSVMGETTKIQSGSWGSSIVLDDYLRWLREYKINQLTNG